MGVYRNLIASHNDFCGCNYCLLLVDYVQMKKYLSTNNRRMDNPDYDFHNNQNIAADMDDITKIREKIHTLKKQKDELKKTAI